MSEHAIEFVNNWVSENINVEAYDPPAGLIDQAVQDMVDEAEANGISRKEIEDEVGDLHSFVSREYEKRTDDEVARLVEKDD